MYKRQLQGHLQLVLLLLPVDVREPVLLRGRGRLERRVVLLEAVVAVVHDAQVRVVLEHVGPRLHALEDLGLDLGVRRAVVRELEEGFGEGAARELAVELLAAVLAEGICELREGRRGGVSKGLDWAGDARKLLVALGRGR